jgi:conjugal transfer mating pair stabilization protein TraN
MIKILTLSILTIVITVQASASHRFQSNYPCVDNGKYCINSGERKIGDFKVHRDCWEWAYVKTCAYPSKNDCRLYDHCYAGGNKGCLLQDSLSNCVNMKKEFSCKSWLVTNKQDQVVRTGFEEKEGKDTLLCKGIPCIDGNCVDKSYTTNGEMMDSLSKLYATSNMKPDKNGNFNLFAGSGMSCSKKPVGYSNCCVTSGSNKGWGKNMGAKCTKDEITLMEQRSKNLCVYVGKKSSKYMGVTATIKHSFCCFGNLLDKVVQVEGRKQLNRNFGSSGKTDCRGFTLEEIQRIDWSKVDFAEFIEDLKVKFAGKYKIPNAQDVSNTIEHSMGSIRKYDDHSSNRENNMSGWNNVITDNATAIEE